MSEIDPQKFLPLKAQWFHIMLSLAAGEQHGYGIMQEVLDRTSGKVLFDQPVTGYTLVRVGSDLTSAERQALPLLAGDLAKRVTSLLVDGTW